ncbi:11562_t:CDS:2 [Gigaspora rosea]|nr:11562_t:CDS:2 [Gigaspora rosea]
MPIVQLGASERTDIKFIQNKRSYAFINIFFASLRKANLPRLHNSTGNKDNKLASRHLIRMKSLRKSSNI